MIAAFKSLKVIFLKPLKLMREFCSKKTLTRIAGHLYNPNDSDEKKALSIGFGVLMGIIPIWGLQTLTAIFLSAVFKLNKTLVGIGSLVSFPPMMPLIIFLSYKIGEFWTGKKTVNVAVKTHSYIQNLNSGLLRYVYGSLTLAVTAGTVFALLTFSLLKLLKLTKQYKLTASWLKFNNQPFFPSISITLK